MRLAYLDPPFNTGERFADFHEAMDRRAWLAAMEPRLLAAWRLLREDGSLWVHCDDAEQASLRVLLDDALGRDAFMSEFASLTLGSGAAAAIIGRFDAHPTGHRIIGGITRAATQFNDLCVGSVDGMFTDAKALLKRGMELVTAAWNEAQRSLMSVAVSGRTDSAASRTAVFRPDKEKSGFGRPIIGRGKAKRSGSPSAAWRSISGPPG